VHNLYFSQVQSETELKGRWQSTWLSSVSRLHCGHTMIVHWDGLALLDRNSQIFWKKTCIWHCTLAHLKTVL